MSETALKAKRAKAKRRLHSAIAGGVFASRKDLQVRWGCTYQTVVARVKAANIPEVIFNQTSLRYRLKDIEDYERQALGTGFQKRAEQLKRLEVANDLSK